MDVDILQQLVEEVSKTYFHKPFRHRAVFNKRLRTTGGRYLLRTHDIELNPSYYEVFGREDLIAVIKHELCHYHLHLEGKGYQHRDADFRELMRQVGAPRFCKRIATENRGARRYEYMCTICSHCYVRKKKVNTGRYVCGKCHGHIIEV